VATTICKPSKTFKKHPFSPRLIIVSTVGNDYGQDASFSVYWFNKQFSVTVTSDGFGNVFIFAVSFGKANSAEFFTFHL